MTRDFRFWTLLAVFQLGFGFAVFAVTRDYYVQEPGRSNAHPPTTGQNAAAWPNGIAANEIARLGVPAADPFASQDPLQLSRQADVYFANRQYAQAAEMYERLLAFSPNNAELLNNLGLTLHYLGRSDEALQRLGEGVAADPDNQRVWLTTGYVNGELGDIDRARSALTNATLIGDNESIRQSAQEMLNKLP